MRTISCLLFVVFCNASLYSQTPRLTTLDAGFRESARALQPYRDSLLIMFGSSKYQFEIKDGLVAVVNKNLKPISLFLDSSVLNTSFRSGVVDGDTLISFGTSRYSMNESQALICKSVNNSVQLFNFGGSDLDAFHTGCRIKNSYYGFGVTKSFCNDTNYFFPLDFYACKTNRVGDLAWQHNFGTQYFNDLKGVAVTKDSSAFLLVGYDYGLPKSGSTGQLGFMMLVMIDTNGNQLWQRSVDLPDGDYESVFSVCQADDDGFYLGIDMAGNTGGLFPAIGKIDAHGDTVWIHRLWDDTASSNALVNKRWSDGLIHSISVLKNGDLLIAGEWTNAPYKKDAFVARYSVTGQCVWRYDYTAMMQDDYFLSAIEDDRGYIYASGYTAHTDSGNYDILLVKLDAFGCVMDTCIMPELPTPDPVPVNASIFPNPFSNALHFNYYHGSFDEDIELNVYNALGRKIFSNATIAMPYQRSVDTSNWATGLYIVELKAGGLVTRFKAVKQ